MPALKQSLAPLEIRVLLERKTLTKFRKDPSQSNRIWIGNHLLEEWIGQTLGEAPAVMYAALMIAEPSKLKNGYTRQSRAELIKKAGLSAASQLVSPHKGVTCCEGA